VSVVGPKGAGKSFLTDSLITNESGVLYRGMSEVQRSIANSPKYHYFTKNNSRVQFIDVRDDISNENFLFLYFLSSVIIFNVKDGDQKAQNEYLKKFKFVNKKLYLQEEDDLSQPRLIFVQRDADEKRIGEEDS
jgi:GTPase SAR1 family protein